MGREGGRGGGSSREKGGETGEGQTDDWMHEGIWASIINTRPTPAGQPPGEPLFGEVCKAEAETDDEDPQSAVTAWHPDYDEVGETIFGRLLKAQKNSQDYDDLGEGSKSPLQESGSRPEAPHWRDFWGAPRPQIEQEPGGQEDLHGKDPLESEQVPGGDEEGEMGQEAADEGEPMILETPEAEALADAAQVIESDTEYPEEWDAMDSGLLEIAAKIKATAKAWKGRAVRCGEAGGEARGTGRYPAAAASEGFRAFSRASRPCEGRPREGQGGEAAPVPGHRREDHGQALPAPADPDEQGRQGEGGLPRR